jgi:hypothetical protein
MAEVDPYSDGSQIVGADDDRVEVVEGFGRLRGLVKMYWIELGTHGQEEIADIVGNIDSDAHVSKMEAVA